MNIRRRDLHFVTHPVTMKLPVLLKTEDKFTAEATTSRMYSGQIE